MLQRQLLGANPGASSELGVVSDLPRTLEQGRALRPAPARLVQPVGDIHIQALRACSTVA
jgi:hypothetical protein